MTFHTAQSEAALNTAPTCHIHLLLSSCLERPETTFWPQTLSSIDKRETRLSRMTCFLTVNGSLNTSSQPCVGESTAQYTLLIQCHTHSWLFGQKCVPYTLLTWHFVPDCRTQEFFLLPTEEPDSFFSAMWVFKVSHVLLLSHSEEFPLWTKGNKRKNEVKGNMHALYLMYRCTNIQWMF